MEKKLRRKVVLFPGLSEEQLVESYKKAKKLNLESDFLMILRKAIDNRTSYKRSR